MRQSRWLAALAAGVVAGGAIAHGAMAAEPRIGKFVSYEMGDYTIITSRSGDQARQFVGDLAKYRALLEKALGRHATNTSIPTQMLIVADADWRRYLQPRENIAGWFQRGNFVNYMTMDGDADRWFAVHVILHEYTHYYLSSQFAGEYPPWFDEGLAEFMSYAKFDGKDKVVLQLSRELMDEARDGDWIPFERLLKIDHYSPEYQSHKLMPAFYAQAWLTVHYGLIENRDFGRQMIAYLNQLNALRPIDEAAKSTFGDLAAADDLLRKYSRNNHMMSGATQLEGLPEVKLPPPKPVSETDALAIFVDVMLETRMGPDRIRPLVESLQRREPDAPRSHILAARLALAAVDKAAFDRETAAAEAALGPDDWQQRRELAGTLLESADGRNSLSISSEQEDIELKRAFKLYGEALAKTHEDVEVLWGFGSTATRLDQNLDLAEQALVAAYRRSPSNGNIAASLASLKGRQDDIEGMIVYLKDAERFATNLGMRQWATSTLNEMQAFLVRRKQVDEENRRQREAYEKQLADYEKKYGKVKRKK